MRRRVWVIEEIGSDGRPRAVEAIVGSRAYAKRELENLREWQSLRRDQARRYRLVAYVPRNGW